MAITLELLEKFMVSEVDNLHLRIDELVKIVDYSVDKLATLERQMSTVFLSLEEIKTEVKSIAIDVEYLKDEFVYIKENMVTKDDLKSYATKADVTEIIEATFKKYLPHIFPGSAQI